MSEAIVDVSNLTVVFSGGRVPVKAVNGVDLKIAAGDAVALLANLDLARALRCAR
jgi:ABC-type dipeptide/oligopeptide/nickel transport system ATPase component